jgi:hypothetical protein
MPAIQVEDVASVVWDTLRDESAHISVPLAGPGAGPARASACETR